VKARPCTTRRLLSMSPQMHKAIDILVMNRVKHE
jgi:hypothetical protein